MRSTIIGVVLAGGLALTGCTASEEPSDTPPAPGTPPADAPVHTEQPTTAQQEPEQQETGTPSGTSETSESESPILPTTD